MNAKDFGEIKKYIFGALISLAFGSIAVLISDHFVINALAQAQDSFVKADVLEVTLDGIITDISEIKENQKIDRQNQFLIMKELGITPVSQ